MDIQQLLGLRKITQAISRKFEDDLKAHLATLAPLFSPLSLFGEYVRGGSKITGIQSEKAYRDLCARFKSLAELKPFLLNPSLSAPLGLFAATPVLNPMEYAYTARTGETDYHIQVSSPLKWTLSYPEATPRRVRELLGGDRGQVEEELIHALLQTLAMAVLCDHRPGLSKLFQSLRFPLHIQPLDGLQALPVLTLSSPIDTHLPEDEIIVQNTQLTGIPSFEEIIDVTDIHNLDDPIRQELLAIVNSLSQDGV
jgi:hypothetical protein